MAIIMHLLIYDLTNKGALLCDTESALARLRSRGCTVALGNFDGVHCGHTAILRAAVVAAHNEGLISAAFCFERHPSLYFGSPSPLITTNEDKLAIFATLGVDYAVLGDFGELRGMSPESFVREFLCGELCCRAAFCGYNYTFGADGAGRAPLLMRLMEKCGARAETIGRVEVDGIPVSSTIVREYIEAGDMETASRLLGRHFFLRSTVVDGRKLGRTIGLPTINQYFPEASVIPAHGVYICRCRIEDTLYAAVTNIGTRPTVNSDKNDVTCESHLIGYSGDLYGRTVKVRFYRRLRGEIKFGSLEELQAQIERDVAETSGYFEAL